MTDNGEEMALGMRQYFEELVIVFVYIFRKAFAPWSKRLFIFFKKNKSKCNNVAFD